MGSIPGQGSKILNAAATAPHPKPIDKKTQNQTRALNSYTLYIYSYSFFYDEGNINLQKCCKMNTMKFPIFFT